MSRPLTLFIWYSEKILDYFQELIDSLEKRLLDSSFTTGISILPPSASTNLMAQEIARYEYSEFESLRQSAKDKQTDLLRLKITVTKSPRTTLIG
jgi:hypothetical protein